MIAESAFLVFPPVLQGKVNTLEDLMKPEVEYVPGPILATLELKPDHFILRSDSEEITSKILPIFESGEMISFWARDDDGMWDSKDYVWIWPDEPGFLGILSDRLAFYHKVSCEVVEKSDFVPEIKKELKLIQTPEAKKNWAKKRLAELDKIPGFLESGDAHVEKLQKALKEL